MAAPIKMDELLVSWLGSDLVYENVLNLIENYRKVQDQKDHHQQHHHHQQQQQHPNNNHHSNNLIMATTTSTTSSSSLEATKDGKEKKDPSSTMTKNHEPTSPRGVIPPFYPLKTPHGRPVPRRRTLPRQADTWEPLPPFTSKDNQPITEMISLLESSGDANTSSTANTLQQQQQQQQQQQIPCVRDQVLAIFEEHGQDPPLMSPGSVDSRESVDANLQRYLTVESFVRITKEVCRFPSFFNGPLYQRILELWNLQHSTAREMDVVTFEILQWYWMMEMEPYDEPERFYRLVKQVQHDFIVRDDFLPFIKALLNDHPVRTITTTTITTTTTKSIPPSFRSSCLLIVPSKIVFSCCHIYVTTGFRILV